ncbi:MAG TPA: M23 family metallopeptidase [Longimicrobiaceae bacterium]|nr:M23 family metallopeptidase [Longimicrobiaceae bacterium]
MQAPQQFHTPFAVRVALTLAAIVLVAAALSVTLAAQQTTPVQQAQPSIRSVLASLRADSTRPDASATVGRRREGGLFIPVLGITADRLRNSFTDRRSGGRSHDAIDIHAPRGTPVVAVSDGEVIKLHRGARGGLSIYQLDQDGRTRYYYAHLDRYAEGVREGMRVRGGDVIGYVGDTGNAQPGDYHLHFAIAVLRDRRRWWQGENLNPFHVLRRSWERVTGALDQDQGAHEHEDAGESPPR